MLFFHKKTPQKTESLEKIPGIEPDFVQILRALGFEKVSDLKLLDAEELYYSLCNAQKGLVDKSVLYQLRCAIYFASVKTADPKKLHWWYWKESNANDTLLSDEDLMQIYRKEQ